MIDKHTVARALREVGMLLEVKGENPFKVRAYDTGARAVEDLTEDLATLVAQGRLTEVRGIGEALAQKIAELCSTGRLGLLERLRAELPSGIGELLQVPDLGPKKIAALHAALGIGSVAELRTACEAGRVREVKGFGERSEQKILDGIRRLESRGSRVLLGDALESGEEILRHLRGTGAADALALAGSARRWKETVGDLDVVAASRNPPALSEALVAYPLVEEVVARGDTKTTVRLRSGLQVDLRVAPPEDYPTLLHHLTGSKAHHVKLRGLARDRGYSLSEWGLARIEGGERAPVREEDDVYRVLGMQPVPPELREDQGEIEAAIEGRLPEDLLREEDIQGMVHVHTLWSDGRASLEEMARATEAMGLRYLTITDHSRSAAYAGGLDAARLKAQWDEIDRVQQKVGVRILRGTEADILEDGALDWPDDIVEQLDVVIASVHSRMRMDGDEMTRRLVRAMRLPFFKIWGHSTGRLLLERDPYSLRMEEVLDAAAASRAAIEVNGDPHRLDMEPRHLRMARERGIPLVVTTDAHSLAGLRNLRFAVMTARRGWARRGEVLNALPVEKFAAAVRPAAS
ncbi:MAG TPA: DNA polymerase/3'-5' exonuclease PolX [Anaeromyxobacteraceae bacterium]|nr:DNA polymerase/3'-5' exonuclease PolX [Anaeromyxobacteraceae bacterium]